MLLSTYSFAKTLFNFIFSQYMVFYFIWHYDSLFCFKWKVLRLYASNSIVWFEPSKTVKKNMKIINIFLQPYERLLFLFFMKKKNIEKSLRKTDFQFFIDKIPKAVRFSRICADIFSFTENTHRSFFSEITNQTRLNPSCSN